jgi:Cu(I)/Ag(I) efflux system membrane protein CusA/SilA
MRRLAAPMIGGLATSFALELLVYPVLFYVLKGVGLRGAPRTDAVEGSAAKALAADAGAH